MSTVIDILLPVAGTLLGLSGALITVRARSLSVAGYSRQTYRTIERIDLKTGLLMTILALLLVAAVPLVSKLLEPEVEVNEAVPIPPVWERDSIIILPPPDPLDPKNNIDTPIFVSKDKLTPFGTPTPVPDDQATPEEDLTPDEVLRLYARQNATPDSILRLLAQADKEIMPAQGEFVAYDREPQAVSIAKPVYPDICAKAGAEGTAYVQLLLNRKGEVVRVLVQKSSGNALLDEAALAAVGASRFTPAMQGDKPVSVWISMPITFKINN